MSSLTAYQHASPLYTDYREHSHQKSYTKTTELKFQNTTICHFNAFKTEYQKKAETVRVWPQLAILIFVPYAGYFVLRPAAFRLNDLIIN